MLKNFLKIHIGLVVLLFVICMLFSSCGVLESNNSSDVDDGEKKQTETNETQEEILYNLGIAAFETGNYTEAYAYFYQCNGYRDSLSYLKSLLVLPGTESEIHEIKYVETVEYKYNSNNWLNSITKIDSDGEIDITTYSSGEMKSSDIEPDLWKSFYVTGESWNETYDDKNNLIGAERSLMNINWGKEVTEKYKYTYDNDNRLIKMTYEDSVGHMSCCEFNYDEIGRLIAADEWGEEYCFHGYLTYGECLYHVVYEYDQNSKLIKKSASKMKECFQCYDEVTVEYTYDENGNLIKEIKTEAYAPEKKVYSCKYNENGDVLSVIDISTDVPEYESKYDEDMFTYDENGKLIRIDVDSYVITYELNEDGFCVQSTRHYGTEEYITKYEYEYVQEAVSQGKYISQMTVTKELDDTKELTQYYYDRYGNIIRLYEQDGLNYDIEYTYNESGLPLSAVVNWYEVEYADTDKGKFNMEFEYDSSGFLVKKILTFGGTVITCEYSEHNVFYDVETFPQMKFDLFPDGV